MQQLLDVDPGPRDNTLLRWQPDHRSTSLWGRHTNSQVVPSILKCRCRSCSLPQDGLDPQITYYINEVVPSILKCRCRSCSLPRDGLDPQITYYINEASFVGLFNVLELEVDHGFG